MGLKNRVHNFYLNNRNKYTSSEGFIDIDQFCEDFSKVYNVNLNIVYDAALDIEEISNSFPMFDNFRVTTVLNLNINLN